MKSFRKANAEFFKLHAKLDQRKFEAEAGAVVGGAVGVVCVLARRTAMGAVGCSLVGVGAGGAAFTYSRSVAARLNRLYDAHRMFQIYSDITSGETANAEMAKQFIEDLEGNEQDSGNILKQFAALMEWGALCEGEQPRSYDEVLELMSGRLNGI